MSRDDAIRLAKEAGFHEVVDPLLGEQVRRSVKSVGLYCTDEIVRLVAAARADERAACLAIVEAPHWKPVVRNELRARAEKIRERGAP